MLVEHVMVRSTGMILKSFQGFDNLIIRIIRFKPVSLLVLELPTPHSLILLSAASVHGPEHSPKPR